MSEAETEQFDEEIIVTAPRLLDNGGGSSWNDFSHYSWLDDSLLYGNNSFDVLAYLLGTDNIFYMDVTLAPVEDERPSVDEFIDTVAGILSGDFVGTITFSTNVDEYGAPIDATFGILNYETGNLDVYYYGRDSEFYAEVPHDPSDFSPLPNQINIGFEMGDYFIV